MPSWAEYPVWGQDGQKWRERRGRNGFAPPGGHQVSDRNGGVGLRRIDT